MNIFGNFLIKKITIKFCCVYLIFSQIKPPQFRTCSRQTGPSPKCSRRTAHSSSLRCSARRTGSRSAALRCPVGPRSSHRAAASSSRSCGPGCRRTGPPASSASTARIKSKAKPSKSSALAAPPSAPTFRCIALAPSGPF